MLKNMRVVAESLLDGSDTTMSPDEVNEALDAASELLAELSPVIRQQIDNAQQQIDDAASAVQVCHAQSDAELRSSLQESTGQHAAAVESCHNTLDQLQTAETQQCNVAEDCLCDEARIRTADQEPLCAAITETYEVAFCEHHLVCTMFHQCHSREVQVFQHLRADVEAELALTVQEYITVEQSRCLTGLIMEAMTPPITPISHAALIACDDVDVSALNINFPDLPSEPAACPAHTHGDPQCEGSAPVVEYLMVDGCQNQNREVEEAVAIAGSGATASVRCCTIAESPVCDSDHVGCQSGKTYEEATAICAAVGQRLCTEVEIEQRLCCGTGCNFDGHQVWALHESINPDYSTSHRGMYLGGYASGDSTVRPVAEAQARCDELESACGGITCRSNNSCTVRAGTNLRASPSGEFSFQRLA